MLFSIIVPIYKVEAYLHRCVDSLLAQTYQDIEIILVDDESPDNCPQICDAYAAKDARVRVLHKKNGGLSDARNKGTEIASGEYLIYVDGDDYIELDTCEKLVSFAEKGADILIGDAVVEGGPNQLGHIVKTDCICSGAHYLKESFKAGEMPMAAWLNVYKKEFLNKNALAFKGRILHEDEQFTPRAFLKAGRVLYTGVVFYHYIIRDNSITTKKDKRKNMRDFYETCLELEKVYDILGDCELKELLCNSLVDKYLGLYNTGELERYGKEFVHKDFVRRNASLKKTKIKGELFCLSPRIYCMVNRISKKMI